MFNSAQIREAYELAVSAHNELMRVEDLLITSTSEFGAESVLCGVAIDDVSELISKLRKLAGVTF